jgi:DNA-binding IclR family transcriptional regulator
VRDDARDEVVLTTHLEFTASAGWRMSQRPLELTGQGAEAETRPSGQAGTANGLQSLTLKKGLQVLSLFDVEHPEWAFADMWKRAGISRPTAFRLVKTLEDLEYLSYDPRSGKYHLGVRMLRATYLMLSHTELARIAHPHMLALAEATTETVVLAVWTGQAAMIVDRVPTSRPFKPDSTLGTFMPTLANVHSRVFLAFGPESARAAALAEAHEPRTQFTITDRAKLAEELARIASEGVAFGMEEWNLGMCAVAAPVFDSGNEVRACMAVVAPVERFGPKERVLYGAAVQQATANMSRQLGYRTGTRGEVGQAG